MTQPSHNPAPRPATPRQFSLHQRIVADLEAPILAGAWPPGRRIPFEHELTAHYNCSRMTVSKALTQLAAAGLIERRRKAGSFVRRPPSQSAVLKIRDIKSEVAALGLAYRFEITRRRRRPGAPDDHGRLDVGAQGAVIDVTCLHFAGAQPFCLEERLINLAAVPEAADEFFAELAPGAWLVKRVPWTAAEHKISAKSAGRAGAALNLAAASACLVIERRTWLGAQPLTHVRLTYPGGVHERVARFTPQSG